MGSRLRIDGGPYYKVLLMSGRCTGKGGPIVQYHGVGATYTLALMFLSVFCKWGGQEIGRWCSKGFGFSGEGTA